MNSFTDLEEARSGRCWASIARVGRFLAWDGAMPLMVALIPSALHALGGGWRVAGGLAAVVVPLFAALFRCEKGVSQIKARVRNPPPLGRQILLAAAIVVLLLFETAANFARICDDCPIEIWYLAAGLYAIYLAFIWAALRSAQGKPALG